MSAFKGTPGPWEPVVGRGGDIRGLRGWHGPESVNVVNWNGISRASSENGQANARLIAAAPELLEALLKLVDSCDDSDGARYGTLSTSFVRRIATAAIAKATGGAA